jgi:hypothetical protein
MHSVFLKLFPCLSHHTPNASSYTRSIMSHTLLTEVQSDEGITPPHTESGNDLNPAIQPWYPCSEFDIGMGLYDLPDVSLDPCMLWTYDFIPDSNYDFISDSNYQPTTTHFPEPEIHQMFVQACAQRDIMFAIREELNQVKLELENMIQELTK